MTYSKGNFVWVSNVLANFRHLLDDLSGAFLKSNRWLRHIQPRS